MARVTMFPATWRLRLLNVRRSPWTAALSQVANGADTPAVKPIAEARVDGGGQPPRASTRRCWLAPTQNCPDPLLDAYMPPSGSLRSRLRLPRAWQAVARVA